MRIRAILRHHAAALLAALALSTAGCAPAANTGATWAPAAPSVAYPSAEWERISTPEAVGWSGAALDSVRARLEQMPTTALMAVVGGRVLFQYGDVDTVSYLASVRKSILSMLFGRYVAAGVVDLDRTLADLGIDDHQGLTEREKRATVRHLLSARSGIFHPASNAGDDLASAPPRGSQEPGAYYLYSNWDFNALGTAFERMTGRDLYDALQADLAEPLGMQEFDRSRHRKSGDLARSRHPAYEGAYVGLGAVGQHILVVPALDLVVVHKTVPGSGRRVTHEAFMEVADRIVEAHCGAAC